MRHSDSSPPIPPRFVAFARRYHPSTCGSLRRTPGATSTASGLVSRCPRPGGLYDGDDEASRGPGKPTRTHATRSDPGEVAASTASETRRDDLPSNARRRPSHSMHFGAQLRGLRAPCERFAPWVTPGPRITRFRLAADLGRMGLDTHRVSNKVSKITSRHLVPLDRAFPAHASVHEPESKGHRPAPTEFRTGSRTRPADQARSSGSGCYTRSTLQFPVPSSRFALRVADRPRRINNDEAQHASTEVYRFSIDTGSSGSLGSKPKIRE